MKVPTFDQMMNPLLEALKTLGGSGTVDEIYEKVIQIMELPDEIVEIPQSEKGNQSKVAYRLAWSRTYLKKYGLLENSARGVWSLTMDPDDVRPVDEKLVVKTVRETIDNDDDPVDDSVDNVEEIGNWREQLRKALFSMEPDAFERLAQRFLRESGFVQVEVTGRSGDGGIDGKGIIRMNGVLSFHMIFQCKKYQGSVGAGHIRDFRGAMQGRADKGLFITTGVFTRDAVKEATRDGAPPIDLIDGDQLINRLRDLGLGVKEVIIKDYEIDADWFSRI